MVQYATNPRVCLIARRSSQLPRPFRKSGYCCIDQTLVAKDRGDVFFFHALGRLVLYTTSQLAATGRMWQGFRELVVTTTEWTKKQGRATLSIQHPSIRAARRPRAVDSLASTWTYSTVEPRPCRVLPGLSYCSSE